MLAIPYAMAKLDSISQAADHYLNAIEAFFEETNRIDASDCADRIRRALRQAARTGFDRYDRLVLESR